MMVNVRIHDDRCIQCEQGVCKIHTLDALMEEIERLYNTSDFYDRGSNLHQDIKRLYHNYNNLSIKHYEVSTARRD